MLKLRTVKKPASLQKKKIHNSKKSNLKKHLIALSIGVVSVMAVGMFQIYVIGLTPAKPDDNVVKKVLKSGIDTPIATTEPNLVPKYNENDMAVKQQAIEELRKQNVELVRQQEISRGNLERERNRVKKIVNAISNNLGGVFKGKAQYIYNSAKKYNLNPYLVAAIMKHETGNGTSKMVRTKNNPGGLTANNGSFMTFDTIESGIDRMCRALKENYIDKGRNSIEAIGNIYCPLDDPRDTQGLNRHWIPTVTQNYDQILADAK